MKNSILLKTILFVSGFVAIGVGVSILLFPVAVYATNNIDLSGQISLLNEVRASGGVILGSGLLILAGAFIVQLRFSAVLISALFYLAFGLSRLFSMSIDGMPADGLVLVAGLEILLGLISVFALVKFHENTKNDTGEVPTSEMSVLS